MAKSGKASTTGVGTKRFFLSCFLFAFDTSASAAAAETCAQIKGEMARIEQAMAEDQKALINCQNHIGICSSGVTSGFQQAIKLNGEELAVDQRQLLEKCPPSPHPQRLSGDVVTQHNDNYRTGL